MARSPARSGNPRIPRAKAGLPDIYQVAANRDPEKARGKPGCQVAHAASGKPLAFARFGRPGNLLLTRHMPGESQVKSCPPGQKTTFYLAFPLGFPRWMLGVPIHSDHACPPNFYLAFSRLPGSPAEADQLSPGFCQAGQLLPGFCQARFEWDLQSKSKKSTMLH